MVELKHRVPFRVRYADTDKMGFMYNGNYFAYFEVGRTELMREYGINYRDLEADGYSLPLRESFAKYIEPAFYDDLLEVEAILKYDGGALFRFDYNIFRNNSLLTQGFTLHVFMNSENKKAVKPPKVFLEALAKVKQV
jgi:acyl-CoA thioester hydrolase